MQPGKDNKMYHSSDTEIRRALHKRILAAHHKNPNTIIVDELGLSHGKNRIDVAVLNGCLHGYEIKSSKDNLVRLPSQLDVYSKTLQKLTIVSAKNHFEEVVSIAPHWSGIILVEKGPRGGIHFHKVRSPQYNPDICTVSLAHLLWKGEAINYLQYLGVAENLTNKTRKKLYEYISERSDINDLICWIKNQFMCRENWRADEILL